MTSPGARAAREGRLAAVIIEPTGGHFGSVPAPASFVTALREEDRRANALLIFDEVVTGFRVAPGGAQELLGVRPDLTTMAKILSGGLPGGACAGREDGDELPGYQVERGGKPPRQDRPRGHVQRQSALGRGGCRDASSVADGQAIRIANQQAAKLRYGMNEILARESVAWKIYGDHSDWKIFFAPAPRRAAARISQSRTSTGAGWTRRTPSRAARSGRRSSCTAWTSTAGERWSGPATPTSPRETLTAFEAAIRDMKEEGLA